MRARSSARAAATSAARSVSRRRARRASSKARSSRRRSTRPAIISAAVGTIANGTLPADRAAGTPSSTTAIVAATSRSGEQGQPRAAPARGRVGRHQQRHEVSPQGEGQRPEQLRDGDGACHHAQRRERPAASPGEREGRDRDDDGRWRSPSRSAWSCRGRTAGRAGQRSRGATARTTSGSRGESSTSSVRPTSSQPPPRRDGSAGDTGAASSRGMTAEHDVRRTCSIPRHDDGTRPGARRWVPCPWHSRSRKDTPMHHATPDSPPGPSWSAALSPQPAMPRRSP